MATPERALPTVEEDPDPERSSRRIWILAASISPIIFPAAQELPVAHRAHGPRVKPEAPADSKALHDEGGVDW